MNVSDGSIKEFTNQQELVAYAKKLSEINGKLDDDKSKARLVELNNLPKKSCRKCHGRGYVGKDLKSGEFIPCGCTKPNL